MPKFIAHVKPNEDGGWKPHLLEEHLIEVSKLAGKFGDKFHAGDWTALAGLWHDLGKYSQDFQKMIRTRSGYSDNFDPEAHLEDHSGKVNHSSAGALHSIELLGKTAGTILAYLIAGHHAGLPDYIDGLDKRLDPKRKENSELYQKALQADIPLFILQPDGIRDGLKRLTGFNHSSSAMALSFWIRMLFSCLIDADFLDTEAFMEPEQTDLRGQYPKLSDIRMWEVFNAFLQDKIQQAKPSDVNRARKEILHACLEKAKERRGVYTLTVPTGGGKTLTSVGYALAHARQHGHARIIYVLPYTSILEQTAQVLREAFSGLKQDCLIEHHSTLDIDKETVQSRLAAENWDAPIVLTTNVQFFESLFANRTSRCRKLHNICNSIIILDEIQQIPPEFKKPIEQVLQILSSEYGATIILSTATQPVLELPVIDELAPNPKELFQRMKRVEILFPSTRNLNKATSWEDLAQELTGKEQVLCIVNRRDDAYTLWKLMPEGTLHLSARMCPAHRSNVIGEIKKRLDDTYKPLRVISTQIVEAGVDIDFPVVYRALSGLDSIAQAAGRCNREGKLRMGQVRVFISPPGILPDILKIAEGTTREFLNFHEDLIDLTPDVFKNYFRQFYGDMRTLDKAGIVSLLSMDGNEPHFQFKEAAKAFKLINEKDQRSVYIPYQEESEKILSELRAQGINRRLLRRMQRYMVNIHLWEFNRLNRECVIIEIGDSGIFALINKHLYYDEYTGLKRDLTLSISDLIL